MARDTAAADTATPGGTAVAQLAQRYCALVEHSPDAICVLEGGSIAYLNPAGMRLFAAGSDVLGRPLSEFLSPAEFTNPVRPNRRAPATLLRPDGVRIPVETATVLTVWQGRDAYQVVLHDLSAQRAAEAARRQMEQHFAAVVSQLEEGVVVMTRDGCIESINPAALRLLGCEGAELVGHSYQALSLRMVDADGAPLPPTAHPMVRTVHTGEPTTGFVFGIEGHHRGRRWLAGNCRPLDPADPHSAVVASFTDITDNRDRHRKLRYQATHDDLTGLKNRATILARLEHALAEPVREQISAVLFVDLDRFKSVNDRLGHLAGDEVLRIIARRLRRAVADGDLIGRLGGDEFLILLRGPGRDPAAVSERLHAVVAEPIRLPRHRLELGVSIGATRLSVAEPRSLSEVLHDADIAMYREKAAASA
ncbi:diguanylate cyclase domain-containing protein [Nocardia shimofusensis]|uniref:diguanylate cyclase domain-containing protein n=1 Tax=Nocardia shimofusensis TaxID=228596 RepID=UPI00082E17CB|nr:diguanylate cyclase [Nocardia shimofusensis]